MKLKTYRFNRIKNTNDKAIQIIKKDNIKNGIIIANIQTKGKGQYGRSWISYKGNLFVTIFFSLEKNRLPLNKLTKMNAKLIIKLISFYCKEKITLKPPNDILINKKKICGILQEIIQKNEIKYLIIGIGLNLIKSPDIPRYSTTDLYKLTNIKISVSNISKKLILIYNNFLNSRKFF